MLRAVPIKCPKCNKFVGSLNFWKQIGDKYFHLCKDCCNIPLSEDDFLLIGFHYGYLKSREDIKKCLLDGE